LRARRALDKDLMRMALLPLTRKGRPAKIEMIDRVIDVATKLQKEDEISASFVLSAMYVAAGAFVTTEQEDRIKEAIDMTGLGKKYEQERERYGDYRAAEVYVELVEKKIQTQGVTEKEACELVGISVETYKMAKAVIESGKELELA